MITKDFGQRVKELRNQTGLSQEKFALKIGMDRTYYASVEAGNYSGLVLAFLNVDQFFYLS